MSLIFFRAQNPNFEGIVYPLAETLLFTEHYKKLGGKNLSCRIVLVTVYCVYMYKVGLGRTKFST
jgi:hypothetical protein